MVKIHFALTLVVLCFFRELHRAYACSNTQTLVTRRPLATKVSSSLIRWKWSGIIKVGEQRSERQHRREKWWVILTVIKIIHVFTLAHYSSLPSLPFVASNAVLFIDINVISIHKEETVKIIHVFTLLRRFLLLSCERLWSSCDVLTG